MKILLISPGITLDNKTSAGLMIPQLALHILEELSGSRHQVTIVEEETGTVDMEEACDLVGISCMTANAPRAYALAQEFRKRGKTVVLGGVHPSILPDEALQYADAVVIGEAEGVWAQLLDDFANHQLQKKYHQPSPSLEHYLPMKYEKFSQRQIFRFLPVMSTRGCPYNCEFCCVSSVFGRNIRNMPISHITRDIISSRANKFIFLDDNIIGKPAYAKELFKAIKPLKIKWVGQASISFVNDIELMKLAADSGCAGLFFGLESVSVTQMKKLRKSMKALWEVEEAVRKVKDLGIHFHASMVFGFDNDTPAVFSDTLEFLQRNKIGTASINTLTPYPGTAVFDRFKKEDRLLTMDWRYYDHNTVVFKPKNMSPYELQTGVMWVKKEFVKISSVLKRLPGNLSHPWLHLGMNFGAHISMQNDVQRLPKLVADIFKPEISLLPSRANNPATW